MTAEVVAAYVTGNHVQTADMPGLIVSVHQSLAGMGSTPNLVPKPEKLVPPVSIRKSLTDDYLISLEDGSSTSPQAPSLEAGPYASGISGEVGLASDYPMVAPAYARKRSELAKSIGLGSLRKRD